MQQKMCFLLSFHEEWQRMFSILAVFFFFSPLQQLDLLPLLLIKGSMVVFWELEMLKKGKCLLYVGEAA